MAATGNRGGTTAGTLTVLGGPTYGPTSVLTAAVRLTNASGKVSGELTATTPRPPGFPELPAPAPSPRWEASGRAQSRRVTQPQRSGTPGRPGRDA